MVLYVRSQNNKTIVDCEIYVKENYTELHCFVDIEEYSVLLLNMARRQSPPIGEVIQDFAFCQELRGWLWECRGSNNADEYMDVVANVRDIFLKPLADKYGLRYVED